MSASAEPAPQKLRFVTPGLRQPAFITLAVLIIGVAMSLTSEPFRSYDNLYNDSRNFAFVAIMGMGEMLVIITGGIDLSVGSVMGLVGIVTAMVLQAGYPLWIGVAAGLGVALLCGLINGYAIAKFKLSPFIVTLIMLSVARSQALVLSNNKMIYKFGPDEKLFGALGGGSLIGIPSVVIVMALLAIALTIALSNTSWGRYVYAIGGNEHAALLTGIPVVRVKTSVYVISSMLAGVAAILMVGWLGAVTNALGVGYELQAIAAAVIGGTDLMGGFGIPYGSVIGAALIEVVRNSLLLAESIPTGKAHSSAWSSRARSCSSGRAGRRPNNAIRLRMPQAAQPERKPMKIKTTIAVAALVAAVQPMTAQAKDKIFALVPKAMNNPFFDQARDGCMKAAKEIGGVQCLFIGPADATEQEQVQVVQDLITRHVDGIGVSAANAPAIAKVLARAKEAKIPVVTWDSDLLPADKGLRSSYIGTVNEQVGIAVAKQAMALKPNGGTYCIQTGGPAAANMNDRIKGMVETLPADKWKQVAGCPLYNNDDFPLSITQLTDLLAKYPKIDAVLDAGGAPEMEVKAYRELMDKYKDRLANKDLVMLFVETLPMQMDDLKAGLSDGQVGQRPFEMGYKAIYLLNDLSEGKSVPDPVTIGLDVCTPETIATCKKQ